MEEVIRTTEESPALALIDIGEVPSPRFMYDNDKSGASAGASDLRDHQIRWPILGALQPTKCLVRCTQTNPELSTNNIVKY